MPFPPIPISLPQQPHGGGGAPPSLEAQRGMTEEWMEKHLGPPRTSSSEEIIRRDTEMRRAASPRFVKSDLPPRPLKWGSPYGRSGDPDPMANLERKRDEVRENFPEVFGSEVPDFLQGNAIDDQKMLWESQMSDRPREIQGPGQMLLPNQTPFYHP